MCVCVREREREREGGVSQHARQSNKRASEKKREAKNAGDHTHICSHVTRVEKGNPHTAERQGTGLDSFTQSHTRTLTHTGNSSRSRNYLQDISTQTRHADCFSSVCVSGAFRS